MYKITTGYIPDLLVLIHTEPFQSLNIAAKVFGQSSIECKYLVHVFAFILFYYDFN
jgi:hypothetical protein